jgi:hypothetical protein
MEHRPGSEQVGSDGRCSSGYIVPRAEGGIANAAVCTGGEAVTAKLKVVVDPAVIGQEALRVPD